MSRIVRMAIFQVKEGETTSDKIMLRLGNKPKVEEFWRNRQLLLLGHISRMDQSSCPRKLMIATR